ncbi:NADH dehydrogenase (complex I) 21kDa subunit [Penicillium malachiteum]|nr:NADH dehydrogenase (complex I) 21kDa subunit [Penicillium malachiteum]
MARGMQKAAKAASNVFSVNQKYTLQSTGIWERIRRVLAVDPERSTGVPLNAQFRLPTPGALPPLSYDDPVTVPAADLADNPYWKRDVRRNYPQLSTFTQADTVSLLTVGSQAVPKDDVLQLGDAGKQQLVSVKEEAKERGLAAHFEKNESSIQSVLAANGLPPTPCNINSASKSQQTQYTLDGEQSYPDVYPCRNFA